MLHTYVENILLFFRDDYIQILAFPPSAVKQPKNVLLVSCQVASQQILYPNLYVNLLKFFSMA